MDIHPIDGVIEIGGTWFAPDLQRTRAATEALFLLLASEIAFVAVFLASDKARAVSDEVVAATGGAGPTAFY